MKFTTVAAIVLPFVSSAVADCAVSDCASALGPNQYDCVSTVSSANTLSCISSLIKTASPPAACDGCTQAVEDYLTQLASQ